MNRGEGRCGRNRADRQLLMLRLNEEDSRMPKIAIIGAGSIIFSTTLLNDLLQTPGLEGSTYALMGPTLRSSSRSKSTPTGSSRNTASRPRSTPPPIGEMP